MHLITFIFFTSIYCVYSAYGTGKEGKELQDIVKHMVKIWSTEIGGNLTQLSKTMTREDEVERSFKPLENKLTKDRGTVMVQEIASKIRIMMDLKADAVQNISEYAEFLSYHRNDGNATNSSYSFYNADNITDNEKNPKLEMEIYNDTVKNECRWMCQQSDLNTLPDNKYSNDICREQLFQRRRSETGITGYECNCDNLEEVDLSDKDYTVLPMKYDDRFDENVNLNMSIAKIAINVYAGEQSVVEGLRWSEPLDMVFKDNFKNDPTLTWQYFASPRGFMQHYPAVKWSDEPYDQTYDFRTRTWYTEAISSPKDIIILLDRSGSITGTRRVMSMQIVNQILDTLNDNDFVNVYTFTNSTEPLVDCFNDTLVQANEENLRLLRENLPVYLEEFAADLSVGFTKAFEILENFRMKKTSARCNQAIMIITEGIDYYYDMNLFKIHNADKVPSYPVRIFTYQIGDDERDAKELKSIACSNMGYWANMTDMGDIREKMLYYLNVMSRPINYNRDNKDMKSTWSYLHVDLADRRLSNWLWKKYEGIRQREVFLDHVKRKTFRQNQIFTSPNHMLLKETHEYQKYEKEISYKYMTTVSLPVYGRRDDEVELIGVAGVDVPLSLFRAQIDYHRIGVNGYAFIVTNNGYILMHPNHRTQFKRILKPTFNRVDIVEVEILDDENEPRLFGEPIVKLREKLVNQNASGGVTLNVKYSLHDMKRLMLEKRHYFHASIGPFTLGIVLPDKYGFVKIDRSSIEQPVYNVSYKNVLSSNWKAHPEWVYCKKCRNSSPELNVQVAVATKEKSHLLRSFLYDLDVTKWFNSAIENQDKLISDFIVHKVFLGTHSGLFRWKTLKNVTESDKKSFEDRNNEATDEDWYRRAVEMNFKDESIFIYSVPFETSGYEDNTMITSTKAIFVEKGDMKAPVAVVGLQFNHRAMSMLYNVTTKQCIDLDGKPCGYTCDSDYLNCFILDNNAYVVLSDEIEFIGRYMGDIRPDVMTSLTEEGIYIRKRMFDYQAICQKTPPEAKIRKERKKKSIWSFFSGKNSATKLPTITHHLLSIKNWLLNVLVSLATLTSNTFASIYQSNKPETLAFDKLAINKTFPTPCDHEMWLYTLNESKTFPFTPFCDANNKVDWLYVMDRIPQTNLLFLAINGHESCNRSEEAHKSPEPREILYKTNTTTKNALPCYIATKNNYTRKMYMDCHNRDIRESALKKNPYYCGQTWK